MVGEFLVTDARPVHYNSKQGQKRDFRLSLVEMGPKATMNQQARINLDPDAEAEWGRNIRGKMVRVTVHAVRMFQNSQEVILDGVAEPIEGGEFRWSAQNGNGKTSESAPPSKSAK